MTHWYQSHKGAPRAVIEHARWRRENPQAAQILKAGRDKLDRARRAVK